MLVWAIIPNLGGSITIQTKNVLLFIIFFQHLPRILLLLPLRSEIINASGALTERAWAGAAYNLLIYMLYAHVNLSKTLFFSIDFVRKTALALFLLVIFILIKLYERAI